MSRILQQIAVKGSQRWLQHLVNRSPHFLDDALRPCLGSGSHDTITWLSPLEADGYAEYQDESFLKRVSVQLEKRSLRSFWPRGGPVWDGLGETSRGDVILIEAKSHTSELTSSCQASPQSLTLIKQSLAEAARFYGAPSTVDWSQCYYQYANRLAHLYLLRRLNGIPAWLVFIYFVNDFEMAGPESAGEWLSAIEAIHAHLGIQREQIEPYVVEVFVDIMALINLYDIKKGGETHMSASTV